jgi:assimilatory nitrate reductase catalytic subunit
MNITITEDGKTTIRPVPEYPVNQGRICPKGFHLLTPFLSEERGTVPLKRNSEDKFEEISWPQAFKTFTHGFKAVIDKHGREAAAFISTGQIPIEEMALLGALAKFGMGMYHGDGNTRQCMATAAVAYKQSFGFDAPPFSYNDFETSDLLVFVGANPVINHPIMWNRVKQNSVEGKIVVIDPRKTETANEADIHIALEPRSDLHFFYALAKILIENGWIDENFIQKSVSSYDKFKSHLNRLNMADLEAVHGIDNDSLKNLAERIHHAKAASFWWTMGVNQGHQAVRIAQSIINIALITGNIGRPGTGANSITGQANAMGSRLFSNTTSMFAGYSFTEEADRKTMAQLLGIDIERIPDRNSLPYNAIIDKVKAGEIKGLWIIATNPFHSWINKHDFVEAMKNLEFLVVQELYPNTETAVYADLYLPAAASGEKSGVFINSERRLGIVQKAIDPPGEAKSDFDIFRGIAEAWGCADMFREWTDPEAVFRILQRTTKGRPCDITGIKGYKMIIENNGIQWPYPEGCTDNSSRRILFEDGKFFTPDGRACLLFEDFAELPEKLDKEFDTILLTGRGSVFQFHTQTRTGKVPFLNSKSEKTNYVMLSKEDALRIGVEEDQLVRVSSRRGSAEVPARISDTVKKGQVFMPMHYMETNYLTFPVFDTYSREPGYKYAAVKIEAVS